MALPYEVVKVIEEAVQDRRRPPRSSGPFEEGLGAVREEARAQKEVVKAELKDELTLKRAISKNHCSSWSRRRDLNPQPWDYKSHALPIELRRPNP